MEHEKLNKYLMKVFNDSINMENKTRELCGDKPVESTINNHIVDCQYIIYNGELIMIIRSNYIRVLRRTIYRLEHNLKENFKSITGLTIQTNHPRLTNEDFKYDIHHAIAPHHSVARCDFFGRPSTITTYGIENYYHRGSTDIKPMEHLQALKEHGYDYTTDSNLSKENWFKYTTAVKELYSLEFKDLTNEITELVIDHVYPKS